MGFIRRTLPASTVTLCLFASRHAGADTFGWEAVSTYPGNDGLPNAISAASGFGKVLSAAGHTQGTDCGNGFPCTNQNVFPSDFQQWNIQAINTVSGHGGDNLLTDMPHDATILYYAGHGACQYRPIDEPSCDDATPCAVPGASCEDTLGNGEKTCVWHCATDADCPAGRRCSALGGPPGEGIALPRSTPFWLSMPVPRSKAFTTPSR
jgi:hypothetical protein